MLLQIAIFCRIGFDVLFFDVLDYKKQLQEIQTGYEERLSAHDKDKIVSL